MVVLTLAGLLASCAFSESEERSSKRTPLTKRQSAAGAAADAETRGWGEDEADEADDDDHTEGKSDVETDDEPNESGRVLLQTVLRMAPLTEGHMMADIMNSPRAFRPHAGLGAWAASSFAWSDPATYPRVTSQNGASFAFVAPEGVNTECRIDNGAWGACSGGYQAAALTDGYHELSVRAAGGKAVLGTYRWKVDTKPAVVFAVRDPQRGMIVVKGNEELGDIKCSLGAQVVDCKAGFPAEGATGALSVEAKDLAGNVTTQSLTL
jgi:hypothetical protein